MSLNDATPLSYARSIAYLGCASTVRARTLDYFGRAPSLKVCDQIVQEKAGRGTVHQRGVTRVCSAPECEMPIRNANKSGLCSACYREREVGRGGK